MFSRDAVTFSLISNGHPCSFPSWYCQIYSSPLEMQQALFFHETFFHVENTMTVLTIDHKVNFHGTGHYSSCIFQLWSCTCHAWVDLFCEKLQAMVLQVHYFSWMMLHFWHEIFPSCCPPIPDKCQGATLYLMQDNRVTRYSRIYFLKYDI